MALEYDQHENCSLCIAWSSGSIYKYFRIADYDPRKPRELKPSKIESDFVSPSQRRDNPDHLYHPIINTEYYGRTEDFFMLQWRPDPDRPGKQLTRVYNYSEAFPVGLSPKEVIVVDGVYSDSEIRELLHGGFPCPPHTTSVFYLAYKEERSAYIALRCERDDFVAENGRLKLKPRVSNFQGAMSIPKIRLPRQQIIWSRHRDTGRRGVFALLGELPPMGRLAPWFLSDFADDYVRWFVRQEQSVSLPRADRQRLATVIRQALDRPDMLEQYVGGAYDSNEVEGLKLAISRYAQLVDDPMRRIICDALVKDEAIYDQCIQMVLKDSEALLEEKRRELANIEEEEQKAIDAKKKEIESLEARAFSTLTDIESAEAELQAARDMRDAAIKETAEEAERLESLRAEEDRVLAEIESNLALRLGLRAAVTSAPTIVEQGKSDVRPRISVGDKVDDVAEARSLLDAVSKNMSHLGVSSVLEEPGEARRRAAISVIAGASACGALAIPSPLADRIADALSVAISGKLATHIAVATDCKDTAAVLDDLPSGEAVIVLDNVIDPVNEAVLFSLLSSNIEQTLIFPFMSYGSARLLARETWERVYIPCIESLVTLPDSNLRPKFFAFKKGLVSMRVGADEVIEEAKELSDDLHGLGLPASGFVVPALVKLAVEESDEDESGFFAVAQHLAMASSLDADAYDTLADLSPDDVGLTELFVRLGYHAR